MSISKVTDSIDSLHISKKKYTSTNIKKERLVRLLKNTKEIESSIALSLKTKQDEHISIVDKLLKECIKKKKLQEEIKHLLHTQKSLEKELNILENEKKERKTEVEELDRHLSVRKRMISLYKKHLGFKIKTADKSDHTEEYEAAFECQFSCIDKNNPQSVCVFNLLLKDGIYYVIDCNPQFEGIQELVAELNSTNDISAFMINMRKKFCSLV